MWGSRVNIQNRMPKNIEHEMETGLISGFRGPVMMGSLHHYQYYAPRFLV